MRVAVFSSKTYDREFLDKANRAGKHELVFLEPRLTRETVTLAQGFDAICVFVNDEIDAHILLKLSKMNINAIALRCAGFNNVDLSVADDLGIKMVRVPAYSPHAVAEHTIALLLAVFRKLHRAHARVREGNFDLTGLLGTEIHGQTVGVIGTGTIGSIVAKLFHAFGAKVLAFDVNENDQIKKMGIDYVKLIDLWQQADTVSLHCPLLPATHHLIDSESLARMKQGVTIINTSRGGLIDTHALIDSLKTGKVAGVGIDVYEEEDELFFRDLSDKVIQDDVFARLLTFPNVVVTAHQAFFSRNALTQIAETTITNLDELENSKKLSNQVTGERVK